MKKTILIFEIIFLSLIILVSRPVTGAVMYQMPEIKPIRLIELTLKNLKTIRVDDIRHVKYIKDECAI